MMKRLLVAILAFLFGPKSIFHKDKPRGVYRMPGQLEEPELPKPVVKEESKTAKWLRNLRERLNRMSYDNFLNNIWKTLWGFGIVGIIGGLLFLLSKIIFTNGNVDYCYVERWTYIKETNPGLMAPKEDPSPQQTTKGNEKPILGQNLAVVYELKGHRNWREDRNIGRFDSLEAAIEGSHKLNCAVEAK